MPGLPGMLVADKAYDSGAIRDGLAADGVTVVIPAQRNRWNHPRPATWSSTWPDTWWRPPFADLKQFRGIVTRYCILAATFTPLLQQCSLVVNTRTTRRGAPSHL